MAALLRRLGNSLFPLSCGAGQVMKWNGAAWACASDGPSNAFVLGGNAFSSITSLGSLDNNIVQIIANGSPIMRFDPDAISPNIIAGHSGNAVSNSVRGATIGGGGAAAGTDPIDVSTAPNVVTDHYGTVGGGATNRAGDGDAFPVSASFATVGGGQLNIASGVHATVGGGILNIASGDRSTVIGGWQNEASGPHSTVIGGLLNQAVGLVSIAGGDLSQALGAYSIALGYKALTTASAHGSFVFSDTSAGQFGSGVPNEFLVAATGGIGLYTSKIFTTGCKLNPGGGQWNCFSSREFKRDFETVDSVAILDRVATLPITSWRYQDEPQSVRHLGPTAQDFHAAFGLGSDDVTIGVLDGSGVALAAIQGLNAKLEASLDEQRRENARLRAELSELRALKAEVASMRAAQQR